MLAFLCALVDLDIFSEIVVYFLMVGHTGNAVDQLFSILTQEFKKSELKTVEELFEKIESAPIIPKPECESLKFIWNWRDYISKYLTNKDLKNHSFYNAFIIKKENTVKEGKVIKLRAKRLPQDEEWVPPTGIRIVQPNVPYDPVGAADFRITELCLPKIVENLQKYFRRMPTHVRVRVIADSWGRIRESLQSLPRKSENLPKMKIKDLPKIPMETEPNLPDEFSFIEDDDLLPEIVGEVFEEGLFDSNICKGLAESLKLLMFLCLILPVPIVNLRCFIQILLNLVRRSFTACHILDIDSANSELLVEHVQRILFS